MAEEGHNSEFMAHASFLTLMLPDRTPGLRRHIARDTDPSTETPETTTTGGGIIGTVKSYLGLGDDTVASIQGSAAAVADSVLPESIKPEAVKGAANTGGADGTDDTPASAAAVAGTDESTGDETTGAETKDDADEDETANPDTDADAEGGEPKKPTPASGKPRENPDAIPTAGGQKLGEEHWGESKVVPDVPKTPQEETAVASEAGQPTDEVKANTASNVGDTTAAPPNVPAPAAAAAPAAAESSTSPTRSANDPEKKGKFIDKIKNKFKKDKS